MYNNIFVKQTMGVLVVLILVVSCTPAATPAPATEAPTEVMAPTEAMAAPTEAIAPTEAMAQPVDFTTWFEYDQNNTDPNADGRVGNAYLHDTIPLFNEAFKGKWNWVNVPKAFNQMTSELVTAVQAGGDVPDIFEMVSDSVNTFYTNGTLQDLSQWAKGQSWYADLDPSALRACTGPDGALYCIPVAQRPNVVFVWKDRFPNGYPKTLDEFMTQAEALKAQGYYAITFFGSTDKGGTGVSRAVFTTIASFGGGYDDGKGNMLLNTPQNIAAIQFLRDIVAKGYVPEIAFAGGFQEENAFKDSSAGSFPTPLNGYLFLFPLTAPNGTKYDTNSSSDFINAVAAGDIYISPFLSAEGYQPGCDTKAAGFAIPVGAKNQQAAYDFINWMMDPAQNGNYVLNVGAGIPTLKATQSDSQFQAEYYKEADTTIAASACRPWYGSLTRPAEAMPLVMNVIYTLVKGNPSADIATELTKAQDTYNANN